MEVPLLNEKIMADLHPRALPKDKHFRKYHDVSGAALTMESRLLHMSLSDKSDPPNIQREIYMKHLYASVKLQSELQFYLTKAKRSFIISKYQEKLQETLKNIEPTNWFFGDNLRLVVENSKAMEKVSKEMNPKSDARPFLK